MQRRHPLRNRGGFTLIELLVVIGIILLLISILMPVVSRVRLAAYDASTQAQMQRIMQACESYYHDWNSYPGPIPNTQLAGAGPTAPTLTIQVAGGGSTIGPITSSENLVLGLLGFLNPVTSNNPTLSFVPASQTPPHDVVSLADRTTGAATNIATYHYIDYVPTELSPGLENQIPNEQGLASTDTIVPEFIDRFPKPLPILYIRANVGGNGTPAVSPTDTVTNGGRTLFVQYNWAELSPYGCNIPLSDGTGKGTLLTRDQTYFTTILAGYASGSTSPGLSDDVQSPYTDFSGRTPVPNSNPQTFDGWLTNPNIAGVSPQTSNGGAPRGKDGFILISAGKDRVYGTHDDTIITP